jgi:endoglucanase Acf2
MEGWRSEERSLIPRRTSCATALAADPAIVRLGAGSYTTQPPPGAKSPPATVYRTSDVKRPMPTCDWWSSLAWIPFSEPMYAHPLALRAQTDGLREERCFSKID